MEQDQDILQIAEYLQAILRPERFGLAPGIYREALDVYAAVYHRFGALSPSAGFNTYGTDEHPGVFTQFQPESGPMVRFEIQIRARQGVAIGLIQPPRALLKISRRSSLRFEVGPWNGPSRGITTTRLLARLIAITEALGVQRQKR